MANLYSTLPRRVYTLSEFNRAARQLFQLIEEHPDSPERWVAARRFVNFTLTGQHQPRGHQAVVDPTRGTSVGWEDDIFTTRDFDSLLGIAKEILVDSNIFVYPVSNSSDTLSTSIHLKYAIERGNVSIPPPPVMYSSR